MVSEKDTGREVVIVASDDFYAFVNGWVGKLAGFASGLGIVHVPADDVDAGFKMFLVPPDQLDLRQ